jgi:NTP pyrophosphatase (non-canonical NTP hydrolase)
MFDNLDKIIDKKATEYINEYGKQNQYLYLIQECAELIQAITKLMLKCSNQSKNVDEEMAHVYISFRVIAKILNNENDIGNAIIERLYRKIDVKKGD